MGNKVLNQTKFFELLAKEGITFNHYNVIYKMYKNMDLNLLERALIFESSTALEASGSVLKKYIFQTSTGKLSITEEGKKLVKSVEGLFSTTVIIKDSTQEDKVRIARHNNEILEARDEMDELWPMERGKYAGKMLFQIPLNYLKWLTEQSYCPHQVRTYVKAKQNLK
jgi:uncharacterized protein (DUF3820 family)